MSGGSTPQGVSKDGHLRRLRLKTVKMLDKPSIVELTAELVLLRSWLPYLVRRDSGIDVEIEDPDDDQQLAELHRQVTGISDPTLSWRRLLLGRPRAFLARGPSPEPSSRASCGAFLQGVAEVWRRAVKRRVVGCAALLRARLPRCCFAPPGARLAKGAR
mmetsp:Transcript_107506/g.298958  ORF Transcript_107506/g.298958 Transcript_107506/m.298958 type:complete len:160 (-) Transcript_107506:148-627(-)